MIEKKDIKKATALKYDENKDWAPKVVAKGERQNAQTIIKIAKQNDIPIKKDEDLIEMLSQIELNQEIPTELYKAVSEIFAFIYRLKNEEENKQ
jgi:flagellar biosynthesis protein